MGYGVAESIMRRGYEDDEGCRRIRGLCLSLRLDRPAYWMIVSLRCSARTPAHQGPVCGRSPSSTHPLWIEATDVGRNAMRVIPPPAVRSVRAAGPIITGLNTAPAELDRAHIPFAYEADLLEHGWRFRLRA
jgi:hypothetical protein